jgi:hypothetical protein
MERKLIDPKLKAESSADESVVVTLPGTVDKIIPAVGSQPEKAQIAVEGAEPLYREIRVENTMQNSEGDDVHLKLGAKVEVKIEAKPDATKPGK